MNGPEHYREAERLLAGSAGVARAQVHATLALAAATALVVADMAVDVHNDSDPQRLVRLPSAWGEVTE